MKKISTKNNHFYQKKHLGKLCLALLLILNLAHLNAQVSGRAGLVERFDFAKTKDNTLAQLDEAAAQLAYSLDSAFQIRDFKVFDFGLYSLSLSTSGELSFDQSVALMHNRIETGGVIAFRNPNVPQLRSAGPPAAYVLITHQFQGGGNVRFNMIVNIPGMSSTGADVSGVMQAMELAGQRAMDQAYAQNPFEDAIGFAKAAGLKAIKEFIAGKADPFATASKGLELPAAMNFVALSGKIIQLPAGAELNAYCVASILSEGVLIGFRIEGKEYVAGGNEFAMSQSNFQGYRTRDEPIEYYRNMVSLSTGVIDISFPHVEKLSNGNSKITVYTNKVSIGSDRIEPLNGTFSGGRLPGLTYTISQIALQKEFVYECGKYSALLQMRSRLNSDGEIQVMIKEGNSLNAVDSEGNPSIPFKLGDATNAKALLIFTKGLDAQGKLTITNAEVVLQRQNIKPKRTDYISQIGDKDPLIQTQNEINTAINTVFAKAAGSGIHQGWNEPAIGTIGRFHCETMTLPAIATVIVDVGVSIYESAAMPEPIWNEPVGETAEKGSYPIHGPPIVCGVADGVIEEVTEIPQLVKLGVELASSREAVISLVASIADITPSKIVELAQNAIKKKWESYTSEINASWYHTAGKDGVAVASALIGVGGIKGLVKSFKEGIQKTGETLARWSDNLLSLLYNKLTDKNLFGRLKDALKNADFKDFVTKYPDAVLSWEFIAKFGGDVKLLTKDLVEKLYLFVTGSGKSLDELADEFNNLPPTEKQAWLEFLEYRSVNGKVSKAGNKGGIFKNINTSADVPVRYLNDSRFTELSFDPAKGKTDGGSLKEAMACLELERQGLVKPKIHRDLSGAVEIFDGDGIGWDVKTGAGSFFNANDLGSSIQKELNKPEIANSISGILQKRRVVLDCTYLDDIQLNEIRNWLLTNLNVDELSRIVEINVVITMKKTIDFPNLKNLIDSHQLHLSSSPNGQFLHLENAEIVNVIISNADISGSAMVNTEFQDCIFSKVDFYRSIFQNVVFNSCIFKNSIIGGEEMYSFQFNNCCFYNTKFIKLDVDTFQNCVFISCEAINSWGSSFSNIFKNVFVNTEFENLFYKNDLQSDNFFAQF